MPDLKLDDISLHYEVDGSGPPLLLHAGMLSDSATWAPLVPLLTEHFTLIRPDNRSTGRTTPGDAPNSGAHMAADVLALMDHLGLTATCRASFGLYNTESEVDTLIDALELAHELFG